MITRSTSCAVFPTARLNWLEPDGQLLPVPAWMIWSAMPARDTGTELWPQVTLAVIGGVPAGVMEAGFSLRLSPNTT